MAEQQAPSAHKILVSLVAKGRRARKPREQKEISFGLADLSGDEELLEKFEHYGAIKALLGLFVKSQDSDAQRFAALALANVASLPKNGERFCEEGLVPVLTEYISDNDNDIVARQYCAMALGNLAVDPAHHTVIIENEGVEALMVLLQTQDPDGGKYSAFALSNLATQKEHRDRMVDKGAISGLIYLAGCDNVLISRQALTTLRAICLSSEYLPVVVHEGVLDPLILLCRNLKETLLIQDVSIFFNVLSTADENKVEMSKRSLISLVSLMLSGDLLVEQQTIAATANIMEMTHLHQRLIDERGLAAVVALCAGEDIICRGEACRCLASLAGNANMHVHIIKEGAIPHLLASIEFMDLNCQRYGALALANLASTIQTQLILIENYTMKAMIELATDEEAFTESRRYALLCLSNFSSTPGNHVNIIEQGVLTIMHTVHEIKDIMAQYYVSCFYSNLSAYTANHTDIVDSKGIESLVTLSEVDDIDIYSQCIIALRNLAIQESFKDKIVEHDGLKILLFGLSIPNIELELLREIMTCLNNISFVESAKPEIVKLNFMDKLFELIFSNDDIILCQCCSMLANVVEATECQDAVAKPDIIKQAVVLMRSSNVAIQSESGRIIANLCSSKQDFVNLIFECGGHNLLISFLLQTDNILHQKVAGIGLFNLCKQVRYHAALMRCGILEPFCYIVKTVDINSAIKRHVLLALATLASTFENHSYFAEEGLLAVLLAQASHEDPLVVLKVAYCIAKLAHNYEMRQIITDEGGLFPVLYLGKCHDTTLLPDIIKALCQLSYVDVNKTTICNHNESLALAIQSLKSPQVDTVRDGCCCLANLAEDKDNTKILMDTELLELLIPTNTNNTNNKNASSLTYLLAHNDATIRREVARLLGNLSVIFDYADEIATEYVLRQLKSMLTETIIMTSSSSSKNNNNNNNNNNSVLYKRIASFALCNISTCSKTHERLIKSKVFQDILVVEVKLSLDPKVPCDLETIRYYLLMLSNICASPVFHEEIMSLFLDILSKFSSHRDVKCREHATFALANLCSNVNNMKQIIKSKCLTNMITFAFPSYDNASHIQYQALCGLRGLSSQAGFRSQLIRDGILEPLIISCSSESLEIRRMAVANLENLSLSKECVLSMIVSGTLAVLKQLASMDDSQVVLAATTSLANMAEIVDEKSLVHDKMISQGILDSLVKVSAVQFVTATNTIATVASSSTALTTVNNAKNNANSNALTTITADDSAEVINNNTSATTQTITDDDIKVQIMRSFALFTARKATHASLVTHYVCLPTMINLTLDSTNHDIHLYGIQAIANISMTWETHTHIIKNQCFTAIIRCIEYALNHLLVSTEGEQLKSLKSAAFACHQLCSNELNHTECYQVNIAKLICELLTITDKEVYCQAVIAIRKLSASFDCCRQVIQHKGVERILSIAHNDDIEVKRECCAALRNISVHEVGKIATLNAENSISDISGMMHSFDTNICYQATTTIANISECIELLPQLTQSGIIQHLKYVTRSKNKDIQREAARGIANICCDHVNSKILISEGILVSLLHAINSSDYVTQRYATLGLANLTTNQAVQTAIMNEGALASLVSLLQFSNGDVETQRYAAIALANLAMSESNHDEMARKYNLVNLFVRLLYENFDKNIRDSSILAMSNFASNENYHGDIMKTGVLALIIAFLGSKPDELEENIFLQLKSISVLRGLSTSELYRRKVIDLDALVPLLKLLQSSTQEIREEALMCLCNLSLSGAIGDYPDMFLSSISLSELLVFLYSNESAKRLFGALALGNIAVSPTLHMQVISPETIDALVILSKYADKETLRCIGYTLCNFIARNDQKQYYLITKGGLYALCMLACSEDIADQETAFISLRVLSAASAENRSVMLSDQQFFSIFSLETFHFEESNTFLNATQLLHCLSLNHDNKLMIGRNSYAIPFLLHALTYFNRDDDNQLLGVKYAVSCLANIAENVDTYVYSDTNGTCSAIQLMSDIGSSNVEILKETSRLAANLCCNYNCLQQVNAMNGIDILLNNGCCNAYHDATLQLFSLAAILNMSAYSDTHNALLTANTCAILMNAYQQNYTANNDNGTTSSSEYLLSQLLKILCNLLVHPSFYQHITFESILSLATVAISNHINTNTNTATDNNNSVEVEVVEVVYDAINLLCKALARFKESVVSSSPSSSLSTTVREGSVATTTTTSSSAVEQIKTADMIILEPAVITSLLALLFQHTYDTLTNVLLCSFKYAAYELKNCTHMLQSQQLIRLWIIIMSKVETNYNTIKSKGLVAGDTASTAAAKYNFDYYNSEDILYEIASCANLIASRSETRMSLVSVEFLTPFLRLCVYENYEIASHVLSAFAYISETSSNHDVLMEINAFLIILPLLRVNNQIVQREACRCIANLLTSYQFHSLFFENIGIDSFARVVRFPNQDREILYNCSSLCRKLTSVRDNHIIVWENRMFPSILYLTSSHIDIPTRLQALLALRDLSSNPLFKLLFVDEDGLKRVVEILYELDVSLSGICMDIVRHLTLNRKLRFLISSSSRIIQIIFKTIQTMSHIPVLQHCSSALVNLSEYEENHSNLIKEQTLIQLIALERYDDDVIQTNLSKVYAFLSSNIVQMSTFFQQDDIHTMLKLTSNRRAKNCAMYSLAALGNISLHIPYQDIIVRNLKGVEFVHENLKAITKTIQTREQTSASSSNNNNNTEDNDDKEEDEEEWIPIAELGSRFLAHLVRIDGGVQDEVSISISTSVASYFIYLLIFIFLF